MDREEAEKREKKLRLERERYRQAVEYVMATQEGRLFVYRVLEKSGVYASSASRASFRTNETFFHEGQRNVGNQVLAELEALTPGSYLSMIKENKGEQNGN